MATDLENLQTRKSAITAELAAMTSTADGGGPSYSVEGQAVSHTEYKAGLYAELNSLNELIALADGGDYEIDMVAR